jgi:transposase InsO family protein
MDRVAMDVVGELPETERGHKYILVISDYFTKWVQAHPIKDQTAQTVADVFASEWLSVFGAPRQVHTDQGRNFESELFSELCRVMGITKTRTTPYHAQSDGLVERFNSTLQTMLKAVVNEERNDWDDHLNWVVMAYRSSVHESTGCTPHLLLFGREQTMPLDLAPQT